MKQRRIIESLGKIEDKFIEEAKPSDKSLIRYGWIKCVSVAACFCLCIAGVAIFNKSHNKTNTQATTAKEVNNEGDESYEVVTEVIVAPNWEDLSITQKYCELAFYGTKYYSKINSIDSSRIGQSLAELSVSATDEETGEKHSTSVVVYDIKGISTNCAVAGKFYNNDNYYAFVNPSYKPETLKQFIEDLNLFENISIDSIWDEQGESGYEFYTGLDTETFQELLFSDTNVESADDYESLNLTKTMSVSVDIPALGYKKISISVTKEGYLVTNILDSGKAFYIGEDKTNNFVQYIIDNCQGNNRQDQLPRY